MARTDIHIVYELGQIETLPDTDPRIVCLDFLVEQELRKRGIPCLTLPEIIGSETEYEAWWELTQQIAREWYRLPALGFFTYKNIRLGEVIEPLMVEYGGRLCYYARIFAVLKEKYPDAYFTIPAPSVSGSPATCFAPRTPWAVIDAARMVGLTLTATPPRVLPNEYSFPSPSKKEFLLTLFNQLVSVLAPRRRFKLYASEYWGYLAPLLPELKDTELMIWETAQFYRVPWYTVFAHRIRFYTAHGSVSPASAEKAKALVAGYARAWQRAEEDVRTYLTSVRVPNGEPLLEAFAHVMQYAARIVADIDTLERVMQKEHPDAVLVMASTGGPAHYFFLMAKVAKQLGIPSLELQHAGAFIDPRSVFSRIETDYLATFGENVNRYHAQMGSDPNRLVRVGSPRFDQSVANTNKAREEGKKFFARHGLDPARPVLLAAVLFSDTSLSGVDIDSYELATYLQVMHQMREKNPNLQILFKFRAYKYVGAWRAYITELFGGGVAIAGEEDIFPLLCASTMVVCGNSTVIYQTLLAQKPLILFPWKPLDRARGEMYAAAAPLCRTSAEAIACVTRLAKEATYRDELLARQKEFLKNYSFDGHSSKRLVDLLHKIGLSKEDETGSV